MFLSFLCCNCFCCRLWQSVLFPVISKKNSSCIPCRLDPLFTLNHAPEFSHTWHNLREGVASAIFFPSEILYTSVKSTHSYLSLKKTDFVSAVSPINKIMELRNHI